MRRNEKKKKTQETITEANQIRGRKAKRNKRKGKRKNQTSLHLL
jgi:hypothetical protein